MSIQLEVQRLENAKSSIAAAIEAKGVTVPPTAKIDTYGDYVGQILIGAGDVWGWPNENYTLTWETLDNSQMESIGGIGDRNYVFTINLTTKNVNVIFVAMDRDRKRSGFIYAYVSLSGISIKQPTTHNDWDLFMQIGKRGIASIMFQTQSSPGGFLFKYLQIPIRGGN